MTPLSCDVVCRLLFKRGLGVLQLQAINLALLAKWAVAYEPSGGCSRTGLEGQL